MVRGVRLIATRQVVVCGLVSLLALPAGCVAGSSHDEAPQECVAQSKTLPAWLATNMPPGAHIEAEDITYVGITVRWRRAVEADTTLSPISYMPEIHLDGVNIVEKALAVSSFDQPGSFLAIEYHPDPPLSVGLHQISFVISDAKGNTLRYDWEFCVEPTSAAR